MPNIGFSRPYVAKYGTAGNNVIYTDGMRLGRGVSVTTDIEASDGNDFYANNGLAESVRGVFESGTVTVTIAELEQDVAMFINGLKEGTVNVAGENVTELIYDESSQSPSMGVGYIKKKRVHSITKWVAVVLCKVTFSIPGEEVNTEEDEIDWQTQDVEGSIEKDVLGRWKYQSQDFDTEEEADLYIRTKLDMPTIELGVLTVTSAAGSNSGSTEVTVTPALTPGNSYVYVVSNNLKLPYGGQICSVDDGFTAWDGSSEIEAPSGQSVMIVEINSSEAAQKAGMTTVVSA